MTYLFYTYVNIIDEKLNQKRQNTVNCIHVHSDLIENIFNAIIQYSKMAKAHSTPKTKEHLIIIIKIIIINENIFADTVENGMPKQQSSKHGPIKNHTLLKLNATITRYNHPIQQPTTATLAKSIFQKLSYMNSNNTRHKTQPPRFLTKPNSNNYLYAT